jgi:hypothetical protein
LGPAATIEDLVLPGSSWAPIAHLPFLNAEIPPENRRLRPFDPLAFKKFDGHDITVLPYDLTPILLPGRVPKTSAADQKLADDVRVDLSKASFPLHAAYPVYVPLWLAEFEELGGERRRVTGALLCTKVDSTPLVSNTSLVFSQPRPLLYMDFRTQNRKFR